MLPATLWGGDMYHIGRIFNDLINVWGGMLPATLWGGEKYPLIMCTTF